MDDQSDNQKQTEAGWSGDWLRQTSPYINAHRGSTFVVWFSGELLNRPEFTTMVHDLTLLSHLGVKLVLVHGNRPQIDAELERNNVSSEFRVLGRSTSNSATPNSKETHDVNAQRITTEQAMPAVRNAIATVRTAVESAFSTGLPNSPMSGAQITVASGNFIVAKPYGIHNGIDYHHTGDIRKIRAEKINALLDANLVVLLSPLGFSPTGEVFNVLSEDVAMRTAMALKADKLIYLHHEPQNNKNPIREISATDLRDAAQLLPNASLSLHATVNRSLTACRHGVIRSQIVDATQKDALLKELFTRDGSGLLIDSGQFDNIRLADTENLSGIMELIRPLIDDGTLLDRSEQDLEREIQNFYIIEREGSVICCASLKVYEHTAELGCLAVHPDFRDSGKATDMLTYLAKIAKQSCCNKLFALSTRSGDWFLEHGFQADVPTSLPDARNTSMDRGSKVFTLNI